jgi:superfamily I DNA/RNA helicase
MTACTGYGRDYDKVYVDEVQDNTQAEVVLYFLAAGLDMKAPFFAGDPAQCVEEGEACQRTSECVHI